MPVSQHQAAHILPLCVVCSPLFTLLLICTPSAYLDFVVVEIRSCESDFRRTRSSRWVLVWRRRQKIPTCVACKCDVSSQGIIGRLGPRHPCPTSPCSCIWGPIKKCLARWSHDPWGNKALTHDLDGVALSVIMEPSTKTLIEHKYIVKFLIFLLFYFYWRFIQTLLRHNKSFKKKQKISRLH